MRKVVINVNEGGILAFIYKFFIPYTAVLLMNWTLFK